MNNPTCSFGWFRGLGESCSTHFTTRHAEHTKGPLAFKTQWVDCTKYQPTIEGLGFIQNQPSFIWCLVFNYEKVKE